MIKELNQGIAPQIREAFASLSDGLPVIRGKYLFVDAVTGATNGSGTLANPFLSIAGAYAVAVAGDCIVIVGRGDTTAHATSYLTQKLAWSKNDIVVVGLNANSRMSQRARIASKEVTTGALTDISFTNSGTADYISRVTGSFLTDGFAAGMTIRVAANSGTNSGTFTILTVTALKITLSTSDSLTTEDAATAGSTTITNYIANLVDVTGKNNTFINLSVWNGDTDVLSLGGWDDSGDRNTYVNCHIVGGAGAAASASAYSIKINGANEPNFIRCTLGTDTIDRGNFASCELLFDSNTYRPRFEKCEFLAMVEGGYTAHLAVKSADADALGRDAIFIDCVYSCFMPNKGARQAVAFGGTAPTSGYAYNSPGCFLAGYAAWSANTDWVYTAAPTAAASAGGGISTTL